MTDHKVLTYLVTKFNPSGRLVKWLLLIEEFDFDIVHHLGRQHGCNFFKVYQNLVTTSTFSIFLT